MAKVKQKKCKQCGSLFTPYLSTKKCCSIDCEILHGKAFIVTKKKKDHARRKREFYDKDRPTQLKKAQQAFNAFIRERDKNEPCISCGRHHTGQYHAGHYRSVGAAPHLRFNQHNVHKQCAPCNNHKSGNAVEYRIRLVRKIGVEKVEWIESQNDIVKLSVDSIILIRQYYTKLLKRMKEAL